jgi:hypothetical protein
MVSAPTMRIPMNVSTTVNAYPAFRAAIRAVKQHHGAGNKPIRSVLCPGLCTAIGMMPPGGGRQRWRWPMGSEGRPGRPDSDQGMAESMARRLLWAGATHHPDL